MAGKKDDKDGEKKGKDSKKKLYTLASDVFDYFLLQYLLIDSFLATCSRASIWEEHILKKAQKEIKKANGLKGKMTKASENFAGTKIPKDKEIKEIQGVIRAFAALTGEPVSDLPEKMPELLSIAKAIEAKYDELVKKGDVREATVFMRNDTGHPIISTHMVLGNLKENLKTRVRNKDKSIIEYQNAIGGTFASEVGPVQEFMVPDSDIMRDGKGKRDLCERPVRFTDRTTHQETTAILLSEQLPKDTKFECILRVVKGSPINENALRYLLHMGKVNGFGAHRGSGNHGHFNFILTKLPKYTEKPNAEGYM